MTEAEIKNLEIQLQQDNPHFAVVLSARAALRTIPALSVLVSKKRNLKSIQSSQLVLSVFRALQASWYTSAFSNPLPPVLIHQAADAADAAARVVASEARTAIFVPAYAAYAAAENNASHTAAVAIDGASSANYFAALQSAYPAGRRQTAGSVEKRTLEAFETDYLELKNGLNPRTLARQRLWHPQRKEFAWMRNVWDSLKNDLRATEENWRVWTDWYDARLDGRPVDESLEFARASLLNDDWLRGPNVVNARIRRLIEDDERRVSTRGTRVTSDDVQENLRLPPNFTSSYNRAESLRINGQLEESLRAHENTIDLFPSNVVAHAGRAEVLREMGRFDQALSAYEEIIKRFPEAVVAYNGRASVLHDLGRFNDALRAYERTIEQFPRDAAAFTGRAEVMRKLGRIEEVPVPPSPEAIPKPEQLAIQFEGGTQGPIDLAGASAPSEHLENGVGRREDYAELRIKAADIKSLGINRLGRLGVPINRFLNLPEDIQEVRLKLFWSRINTLRIVLASHEKANTSDARFTEPDERRLEPSVFPLLKDLVETINVFVIGDAVLMELDALRPGPQDIAIVKEEATVLASMLDEAVTNLSVATELAQEVLKEQTENLRMAADSLPERQAAVFSRRTIRNFVGELLRRAYAPVLGLVKSETTFAWKGVREGVYRAVGAGALLGATSDLAGLTKYHQSFMEFVARHADALTIYTMQAFQNPAIVEIIHWITRVVSRI